jgi:cobalt-zinc-cadmium efflux system protein
LIDPILSVAVAALILKSAWSLVKRSAHILLEGAPEWLDVQMMQDRIVAGVPGVSEIHHVHIWGLTPQELMLTMHMGVVENASQADVIRDAKRFLKDEYGIGHATIEVDVDGCSDH